MSTNLDHHASEPNEINNADSGTDLTLDSVARRRLLLKNIGKGAAALAVTVPVQTLAQGTVLLTPDLQHRCTVSGMQSGIHSQDTTTGSVCGGWSPGYWQQVADPPAGSGWRGKKDSSPVVPRPKNWPANAIPDAYYTAVFPNAGLTLINGNPPTLWEVMSRKGQGNYKNTDMFHWIGAWLNGFRQENNFPYTHDDIADLYANPTTRAPALALIKTHLENHGPAPDLG